MASWQYALDSSITIVTRVEHCLRLHNPSAELDLCKGSHQNSMPVQGSISSIVHSYCLLNEVSNAEGYCGMLDSLSTSSQR